MRASIFGNLRSGINSAAGSPSNTPLSAPKADSAAYNDVEPLSLPPPATSNNVLGPPPITAPRSRPLTRLTPFGRKASPARHPADLPAPTASPVPSSSTPTASPSLAATGVSYLDSLGLRLGEAVNKALILPAATHPAGGAAGITKAAAVGSGAKVGASASGVGVSEGPDAVLKGKRPLPVGRGRALGALITRSVTNWWIGMESMTDDSRFVCGFCK